MFVTWNILSDRIFVNLVRKCSSSGSSGRFVSTVRGTCSPCSAMSVLLHRRPSPEGSASRSGTCCSTRLASATRSSVRTRTRLYTRRYIATISHQKGIIRFPFQTFVSRTIFLWRGRPIP